MNASAVSLSLLGLALILGTNIAYLRTIPRGNVPKKVGGFVTRILIGVFMVLLGSYLGATSELQAGLLVYIPAALGVLFALPMLFFFVQPKAPLGDIKVAVGDTLLPFVAKTSAGTFNSAEFEGQRVLLKFYRGGWCPYCSSELMAFDEMSEDLNKFGVRIYALSKDPPDEAAIHKSRDHLSFPLLSDPNADVIRTYGVEHHKALNITKVSRTKIGGIPLGFGFVNFQTMAIPTTLLVDETGTVRWIDQAEDYRIRSATDRIAEAVEAAFGADAKSVERTSGRASDTAATPATVC